MVFRSLEVYPVVFRSLETYPVVFRSLEASCRSWLHIGRNRTVPISQENHAARPQERQHGYRPECAFASGCFPVCTCASDCCSVFRSASDCSPVFRGSSVPHGAAMTAARAQFSLSAGRSCWLCSYVLADPAGSAPPRGSVSARLTLN